MLVGVYKRRPPQHRVFCLNPILLDHVEDADDRDLISQAGPGRSEDQLSHDDEHSEDQEAEYVLDRGIDGKARIRRGADEGRPA